MREPIIMQDRSCKEQNGHYNDNTLTLWSNLALKLLEMVHSPVDELHQQTLRRVLSSP